MSKKNGCSWQGSNLRLPAHKTSTLTTELQELLWFFYGVFVGFVVFMGFL